MIQEPLAIVGVLFGVIVFSLSMVHRYGWAERLSPIIWIIFTSALCSNLGLIPTDARVYGALIFLAVGVMAVSNWLKAAVIDRFMPGLPVILIVTTLALVIGQLRPVRRLEGAWEIGDLAFYLFFAAVGALIDFYKAVVLSPILFLYVVVIMAVHMLVLYGVGRWLRMDVGVLTIASVATKAGPALVAPVAETKGWRHLVLPGMIVAMLGYAIGNYVGYAVGQAVRATVGG